MVQALVVAPTPNALLLLNIDRRVDFPDPVGMALKERVSTRNKKKHKQ